MEGVGGIAAHQPDLAREAGQRAAGPVHEPLALEPLDDRLAPAQQLALADVQGVRAQQRQPAVGGVEVRPVDLHEQPLAGLDRAAQGLLGARPGVPEELRVHAHVLAARQAHIAVRTLAGCLQDLCLDPTAGHARERA